jgi:nicotinate phosphoribosyltransferase
MKYTDSQYEEILHQCKEDHALKLIDLKSNRYIIGKFSDFGTRRRFSKDWMDFVVKSYASEDLGKTKFVGTSNVALAMKYDLTPVGTNAHEWYMAAQGIDKVSLAHTNAYMLGAWIDEYKGDLGTALTDCLGSDHFLKDFDLFHTKLWDGLRNDSGNPFEWGDKMLNHYKKMRVDPKTKTLLFSNALDFKLASGLHDYFKDKCNDAYGIGTYLTGAQKFKSSWGESIEPLNIVIKMVECNGKPVAKLSDDLGKGMCDDDEYVKYLSETIRMGR